VDWLIYYIAYSVLETAWLLMPVASWEGK